MPDSHNLDNSAASLAPVCPEPRGAAPKNSCLAPGGHPGIPWSKVA